MNCYTINQNITQMMYEEPRMSLKFWQRTLIISIISFVVFAKILVVLLSGPFIN